MTASLPKEMRAVQWSTSSGGVEKNVKLTLSAPLPVTGKGLPKDHMLVKVSYVSLNPVDYKFPDALPFLFTKPATPCVDFSGTVVLTASTHETANFVVGDRVCGRTSPVKAGAMAEYVAVPMKQCIKLSDKAKMDEAACIATVGITAFCSLKPYVKQGSRVLINGASGGTGTFGIQIAKALGAAHVTAICSGANAKLCTSLGADTVVDYKTQHVAKTLGETSAPFDLIVDNVSFDLFWLCAPLLHPQGTYVSPALTPSFKSFSQILQAKLTPVLFGGIPRTFQVIGARDDVRTLQMLANWVDDGTIKVFIGKEYGLEDGAVALRDLKRGSLAGKTVVKVV